VQNTVQQQRAGPSYRHAAAGVGSAQQRLQRLVSGVLASFGPEGAGGHDAAPRQESFFKGEGKRHSTGSEHPVLSFVVAARRILISARRRGRNKRAVGVPFD
jgi:hypothetical protein